jgi:hypothetical protein
VLWFECDLAPAGSCTIRLVHSVALLMVRPLRDGSYWKIIRWLECCPGKRLSLGGPGEFSQENCYNRASLVPLHSVWLSVSPYDRPHIFLPSCHSLWCDIGKVAKLRDQSNLGLSTPQDHEQYNPLFFIIYHPQVFL